MPAGVRLNVWQVDPDAPAPASAVRSGGALVPMREGNDDVEQLAALLNRGGQWSEAAHGPRHGGADIGYWLVPLMLPLAALAFRRGVLLALLIGPLLLGAALLPRPAMALDLALPAPLADYWAWRQLEAGQPAAAERFADPRWRAAAHYRAGRFALAARLLEGCQDADSHYNRGNALAKQGRLVDALAAYEAALFQRPADADYVHNRDLMRRLLNQGNRGRPPPPPPSGDQPAPAAQEAARLAEQWLRQVPDQPGTLLRRKLQLEQRRRQGGTAERAW
jgi:Ca-activated chloride channel homolog